jgi:hypothetical protein
MTGIVGMPDSNRDRRVSRERHLRARPSGRERVRS